MELTIDLVMSWNPCYSREDVERLADGRASITPLQACDLPIPARDRLWLLLRPECVPEPALHRFACDCAARALQREREAGRESDPRSWAAIETKRRWLDRQATDEELAAAGVAARFAAWVAAGDAARDAAEAAAEAAAGDAARAAAWVAAWVVADGIGDVERERQIDWLRSTLGGGPDETTTETE